MTHLRTVFGDLRRGLFRSRLLQVLAVLSLLAVLTSLFLTPIQMTGVVYAIWTVLCFGVAAAFTPLVWAHLKARCYDERFRFAIGIQLSWLGAGLVRGWWWLWRLADRPVWMTDAWLVVAFSGIFLAGGLIHLHSALTTRLDGERLWLWFVGATLAAGTGIEVALGDL